MSKNKKEDKPRKNWIQRNWLITVFLVIIAIVGTIYTYKIYNYWLCHPSEAGQFGDMFGAITAFIGTLTLIFIVASLKLQREEYNLALEEMQTQTEINKKIQRTARLQRIETTFFKLIELFNKSKFEIKSKSLTDSESRIFTGENIFIELLNRTNEKFYLEGGGAKQINPYDPTFHNDAVNKYTSWRKEDAMLSEYYAHLNNIMSLLSDSKLSDKRNKSFLRILKAYIPTKDEMVLQFLYIGLSPEVEKETKEFVAKSNFYRDIDKSKFSIMSSSFYRLLYPKYDPDGTFNQKNS